MVAFITTRIVRAVGILFLIIASCSGSEKKSSIWYGNVEVLPGFITPFEFELTIDPASNSGMGRFHIVELMASGGFASVIVTDSLITMNLGNGVALSGKFGEGKQEFQGKFIIPGSPPVKVVFQPRDNWSSAGPARVDALGRPIRSWNYSPPSSTGDGWEVSSLGKTDNSLKDLFQKIMNGNEYQGIDALLIAHNGKLILEEYFHLGTRDRIHTIQSDTKSITSLLIGKALEQGHNKGLDLPLKSFFQHTLTR